MTQHRDTQFRSSDKKVWDAILHLTNLLGSDVVSCYTSAKEISRLTGMGVEAAKDHLEYLAISNLIDKKVKRTRVGDVWSNKLHITLLQHPVLTDPRYFRSFPPKPRNKPKAQEGTDVPVCQKGTDVPSKGFMVLSGTDVPSCQEGTDVLFCQIPAGTPPEDIRVAVLDLRCSLLKSARDRENSK